MANSSDPTVSTPTGAIIGTATEGVHRFTGIPYATAARWQLPTLVGLPTDRVDAQAPAPACPQIIREQIAMTLPDGSPFPQAEDCLRLSITVPAEATRTSALPVMVWIHGGSYVFGAGDWPIFDPASLVREGQVIVVSVTYRLGLFGFLGWPGGPEPNLGLLDMLTALRWISSHIDLFGGDPANVTLFGQSAGGDAIAHLMIADGSAGLFQRAIIQSAPLGLRHGKDRMIRAMGRRAASLSAEDPAATIVAAQVEVAAAARRFGLNSTMPFGVNYGHRPLPPETEAASRWADVASGIELLIGTHAHEVSAFLPLGDRRLRGRAGQAVEGRVRRAVVDYLTRRIYAGPAAEFARHHSAAGGRAWQYGLDWAAPNNPVGAAHSVELPLLFPHPDAWRGWPPLDGASAECLSADGGLLRSLWTRFARNGELPDEINQSGLLRLYRVG